MAVIARTLRLQLSMSAWAPGAESEVAVADIGSVADPGAQRMFQYLLQENHKMYCLLRASIEASNAAAAGLATVSASLESVSAQLATVVPQLSQVFPLSSGVLPLVINAASPIGSLSNVSGSSDHNTSGSSSSSDGPLQCPFCPHRHSTEKVHCQHLLRLMDRFVLILDDNCCL